MNNFEDFKNYLSKHNYSYSTIDRSIATIKRLQKWQQQNNYITETLTYNELLAYVNHLKSNEVKPHSINIQMQNISLYYDYLQQYGYTLENAAKSVRVKGKIKTVYTNLLNMEELQNVYHQYNKMRKEQLIKNRSEAQQTYMYYRNIVLLGLLIYQGLQTTDVKNLLKKDIDLDKGVIYLQDSRKVKGRIITLAPIQILPLSEYINTYTKESEKLIKETSNMVVSRLIKELKGINPQIQNIHQLRAGIIIEWIKKYGKRKAQYLAGHKYISSTEKYEQQNTDALTDLLKKHHPFG